MNHPKHLLKARYEGLQRMDFVAWRSRILSSPVEFQSWSFCSALTVEGDGIDSMADGALGAEAMRQAVGEAFEAFSGPESLERQIRWCVAQGRAMRDILRL